MTILHDKLSQPNIKIKGYILDGFTKSQEALELLYSSENIRPSTLIYLNVP